MAVFWIWNELEIEPTNDRRAIKRAYAKKSLSLIHIWLEMWLLRDCWEI